MLGYCDLQDFPEEIQRKGKGSLFGAYFCSPGDLQDFPEEIHQKDKVSLCSDYFSPYFCKHNKAITGFHRKGKVSLCSAYFSPSF